eukprot:CAMPEP_0174272484 /NCGR_PEP_ID=MMETSP0439-20130205/51414_1 /TAXON_ID=0 /ORGANISM="Stereomyxa ramosa, Strain Chinc5" /LENGTH=2345 /DNA_ID=CAMNT_0015363075 /DNA_START=11 /DNA_END=7048 /DNA_ORIENTATION=+
MLAEHKGNVLDLKAKKLKLVNSVCASMIAEPRFDNDSDSGAAIILSLVEEMSEFDPEFILKLAVYLRQDLNVRSTSNFLVALAANNQNCTPFLKKYFKTVIRLPSDWLDVAALYQMLPNRCLSGRALPTALRKAMLHKFPEFDTYQLGKYNKQGKIKRQKRKEKKLLAEGKALPPKPAKTQLTMKQMIRQLHISQPVENVMCVIGKKYPSDETEFRRSGLPGVYDPKRAGKRMKLPVPETWETLLSAKGNKAETWQELIDHNKLPFMAMLRNLRNLILVGVEYKYHRWAMNKLNNEVTVSRSRQFPFRFFSAYEAINIDIAALRKDVKEAKSSGARAGQKVVKGKKGAKEGEKKKRILIPKNMPDEALIKKYREALDNAVKFATVHNVKPIRGSTVVFCCVNEDMNETCFGARGVGSVRTHREVGILLGLMCKYMCEECDFRIFAGKGASSKCHVGVELQDGTILDNMKIVTDLVQDGSISVDGLEFPFDYLEKLIRKRKEIHNFIILSNKEIFPGSGEMENGTTNLTSILQKYRQEVNPDLLFVSVNLAARPTVNREENTSSHPNDVLIGGFSDSILKYIAERGDDNQLHYIDHIDEVKGIAAPKQHGKKDKAKASRFSFSSSSSFSSSLSNDYSSPFKVNLSSRQFGSSSYSSSNKTAYSGYFTSFFEEEKDKEVEEVQAPEVVEDEEAIEDEERKKRREVVEKMKAGECRMAKLFVSSTFRDMHGERDHLVRFVFPELRERCKARKIGFYDVDLRWGVTGKDAEESSALEICLDEIDKCRPFFLGILGERYGWTPPSYKVSNEPRFYWTKNYPQGRSITELEMYYGALKHPEDSESFFYFRDPSFMDEIAKDDQRAVFSVESEGSREKMGNLKKLISEKFKPVQYGCSWGGVVEGKPMVTGLEEWGRTVLEDLWGAICRTFPEEVVPRDYLSIANDHHSSYMDLHTKRFVGRSSTIKELTKFVNGEEAGPLVVVGDAGTGKSALLAQFAKQYSEKNDNCFVVSHFIGASPDSTDIRHTLFRICKELSTHFSLGDVPEEYKELKIAFVQVLEQLAFHSKKVVIILDGLDQLDEKERAHSLDWLPGTNKVRVIVSTRHSTRPHDALRHRKPELKTITVGLLEETHAKELVRNTLWDFRKKLDESPGNNQMRFLMSKKEATLPLFLVVACEELRVFGVYEKLTAMIKSLPVTTSKLFGHVLQRLETDQPKELLKMTLCLIHCGRGGVLESEVTHIIGWEKFSKPLPMAVWSPLISSLSPFLRPTSSYSEDLLAFFHKEMELAVKKKYLVYKQEEATHRLLASYFLEILFPNGLSADEPLAQVHERAISELPYHLTKGSMWSELVAVLCNLNFVEIKCQLGLTFDLVADLSDALHTSEEGYEGRDKIQEMWLFVSSNSHILATNPQLTFQQAYNQPEGSAPNVEAKRALRNNKQREFFIWKNKPESQSACLMTLKGNTEAIMACDYSPDGQSIVIASRDQTLRVCDAVTGVEKVTMVGHTNWVVACQFSPDGRNVVSASWDQTVKIWDAGSGAEITTFSGHQRRINTCCYSHDGKMVASGSWDCSIKIWSVDSGKLMKTLSGHTKPVNAVSFSPDNKTLVSASWDCSIKLWELESGQETMTLQGHTKSVRSVKFSPTGNQVVSTSVDTTIKIWDVRTGSVTTELVGHSAPVNTCDFSSDGKSLVSASEDLTVRVWDALGGRGVGTIHTGDGAYPTSCDFSPDERFVACAFSDCRVGVWDVLLGTMSFAIDAHTRTVNTVKYSHSGDFIATCSDDSSIRVWDAVQGGLVIEIKGHRDCVNDLAWSPDDREILSASDDFSLKLWRVSTGEEIAEFKGHTNRVVGCCFAPTIPRIASAARDGTLRIWDPKSGSVKKIFKGHMDWLTSCSFSPDSKRLVSCSWDFTAKVWDVRSGKELQTLVGHAGALVNAMFSADGQQIVTGSLDGQVKIWDAKQLHEITTIDAHPQRVNDVRCSTGHLILTCSDDGTFRIFDSVAGQEITSFQGHAATIRQVSFAPAQQHTMSLSSSAGHTQRVVSASDDCTLKVWNAEAERETKGHAQWVTGACVSRDDKTFATCSRDASVRLWDAASCKVKRCLDHTHSKPVNSCDISPDGSLLVTASDDFSALVWDLDDRASKAGTVAHKNAVKAARFSPDGQFFATASWDGTVGLHTMRAARTATTIKFMSGHKDWVNDVAWSANGMRLASGSHDRTVVLWDPIRCEPVGTFAGHSNWVSSVAFSPDDPNTFASSSYDCSVALWDARSPRSPVRSFAFHDKRVYRCCFSADGSSLLSVGADGVLFAHSVSACRADGPSIARFFTKAPATALAASSSHVVVADSLGNVYLLDHVL